MERLSELIHGHNAHRLLSVVLFLATLVIVYFIYKYLLNKLRKHALRTSRKIDDFIVDLLRVPVIWWLFWIIFRIFSAYSFISETSLYNTIARTNNLVIIAISGWIVIKLVRIIFYYLELKLENEQDRATARSSLTKTKIFEGIIVAILTVIIIALCLMTFDKVRAVGVSLLTSAGIAGIIVGLAAQKSIGAVLAGIQIAITQPIRLGDQVMVEGEVGNVEEITLTYVVVRLWTGKRMVLPVNYFLDNHFQNWTLLDTNILDYVYLYTDYNLPLEAVRKHLTLILANHPKWDKKVANVQITGCRETCMEVRLLVSSVDTSASADLIPDLREKMVAFINKEYPECLVRTRIQDVTEPEEKKEKVS